jgi:hypothetical protein
MEMTNYLRFKGGIQNGTVATDARARKLDKQCKHLKRDVYELLKKTFPKLTIQNKLTKEQIPGGKGACQPDGGAWFYDGVLIAIFEGKKQQDRGNAIERWYKNNYIARKVNPDVSYVTFCTGEGAYEDGKIGKALHVAHLSGYNQYNPGDNSAFLNTDCFTEEEIRDRMIKVICERIDTMFGCVLK